MHVQEISLGVPFLPCKSPLAPLFQRGELHGIRPFDAYPGAYALWEREQGTRVSIMSKKTYPCEPLSEGEIGAMMGRKASW